MDPASTFDDDSSGSRGPRTATVFVLSSLLTAAAAATGYYAWTLWTAREELSVATSEVAMLTTDRQASASKLVLVARERDEQVKLLAEAREETRDALAQLAAVEGRLSTLEGERASIDAELAEFRRITKQFQRMIDSGKLDVTFRNGRMVVELPAQVLFPSGKDELTKDGRRALRDVAKVLRGVKRRRFVVAGHTDNVPVSNQRFPSNWHLSTARALRVTDALIEEHLKPQQLVAAGYAEFEPVASNRTERGRQRNRRIEIVLEPQLRALPGLTKGDAPVEKRASAQAVNTAEN